MLALFMRPRIQSRLQIVLAEHNLERSRKGLKPLTLLELAEATGLAKSTLTGMTANRHEQVSFKTLAALCAYFERPPGDFLQFTPGDDTPEAEPKPKRRRASRQQPELASRAGQ